MNPHLVFHPHKSLHGLPTTSLGYIHSWVKSWVQLHSLSQMHRRGMKLFIRFFWCWELCEIHSADFIFLCVRWGCGYSLNGLFSVKRNRKICEWEQLWEGCEPWDYVLLTCFEVPLRCTLLGLKPPGAPVAVIAQSTTLVPSHIACFTVAWLFRGLLMPSLWPI